MVPVEHTAEESLLVRTARGAGWVIGWRLFTRALGMLSTLVLVRLLVPADFGLMTLATGFAQALNELSALGVEEAVIRERQPGRDLYDTGFTINLIRGAATAALIAAAAWPVARFFADRRLVPVLLALALGALVAGAENIGIVDFRRDIRFHKEFVLLAIPRLAGIAVAISLACLLHSYAALLAATLVTVAARVGLGYAMHPFRPRLRLPAWRRIAGFSFWSWLLSLGNLLNERADSFVIGRVFGLADVGIFALGAEIAALPTTELISPLSRACFSGFAAARDGTDETAATFLRVIAATTLVTLPAGVGLSLVAAPVVRLAFGPGWAAATPVVELLGVALVVTVLGYVSYALMNAHARLRGLAGIQALTLAVRLALLVALVPRAGLTGAAAAVGLAAILENLLYFAMAHRFLDLRAAALLAATWRSLLGAIVMAAALAALGLGWRRDAGSPAATLALAILLGAVLYAATVALCWIASGRPPGAERDLLGLLRRTARR
jgi:O-antigen/teichoic acid export membrane protein